MTEEEVRDLLLSDLCGRLPYGVKLHCTWHMYQEEKEVEDVGVLFSIDYNKKEVLVKRKFLRTRFPVNRDGCNLKPYLRPMSSMTEDEAREMFKTIYNHKVTVVDIEQDRIRYGCVQDGGYEHIVLFFNKLYSIEQMDWLNSHHFDYRGLIEKGLALEAPEGMY